LAHLKNPFRMAVVLLFGALVLTACQAFEYTEVDVEMGRERVEGHSEGFVHTNAPSVVEGEITFVVKNEGEFNHNFIVLETDLDPDKLILKGSRVDLGASGKERGHIQGRYLFAGASNNHTFRLGPGAYVLLSNEPGDYASGMFARLVVAEEH